MSMPTSMAFMDLDAVLLCNDTFLFCCFIDAGRKQYNMQAVII